MNTLILLLATITQQEDTIVAKVNAPETVKIGEPLILDATESIGQVILWKACNIKNENYRVFENGKIAAVWPEKPGEVKFILFVSSGEKAETQDVSITVTGTSPSPTPNPNPQPNPPEPNPSFGIDKKVAEWYKTLEGDESHSEAARISATFLTVAGMTSAGLFGQNPDMSRIAPTIAQFNQAVIPEGRRDEWADKVLSPFGSELSSLIASGKVKTKDDFTIIFTEVAKGLAAQVVEK
tara:strand:+ start:1743 stop:2456 length:714 start_codon:yes stop_codon:yes gene_type:complete